MTPLKASNGLNNLEVMASIRITSMDSFTDEDGGTLVLVNPDDTPRPINYWAVPRWWAVKSGLSTNTVLV